MDIDNDIQIHDDSAAVDGCNQTLDAVCVVFFEAAGGSIFDADACFLTE